MILLQILVLFVEIIVSKNAFVNLQVGFCPFIGFAALGGVIVSDRFNYIFEIQISWKCRWPIRVIPFLN
jgi:hypothetical protein